MFNIIIESIAGATCGYYLAMYLRNNPQIITRVWEVIKWN